MIYGYNKFKELQKERQQPPWEPSPKKQRIMKQGTATLFAGKFIPSSWGHFDEIYPVIFLSLKGFDSCDTWLKMEALLCHDAPQGQ
ncbi:unnamed protein product [Rhizophagus irregularis]|nr:unnamed protein product [Rhizophagus irregularis]